MRREHLQALLRLVEPIQRKEGLDGNQLRLHRVPRRGTVRTRDVAREMDRAGSIATSQRQARLEGANRPLIPAAGQRFAIRVARFRKRPAGGIVLAANQVNLREGIEDRAGGLAHEMKRAAHVERAIERFLRAGQVAHPHADLPERGERHAEPVRRARLFLQLHAALGERQGLLVPVQHQRDVRLVAAHRRQDVARLGGHRDAFGVLQRGHRLVQAPLLRQRDARERMHHRDMTAIAGRIQRRRCLRDVLANNGDVADLAVAQTQLVVRKANGPGVVRPLRLLEGLAEEGDSAGRLAVGDREAAVHAPDIREPGRVQTLAPLWRWAQGLGGAARVVLQQPGIRQGTPHLDLVVAPQPRLLQRPGQPRGRIGAVPVLERLDRLCVKVRNRHGRQYTSYTA